MSHASSGPASAPPLDPALDLLVSSLLALQESSPARRILLLGAAKRPALSALAGKAELAAIQPFRPEWLALQQAGVQAFERLETLPEAWRGKCERIALLPYRNRQRTRFLIAAASRLLSPSPARPALIACQENRRGARALETDLKQTGGDLLARSKHKCRLLQLSMPPETAALNPPDEWLAAGEPRRIEALDGLISMPGLFSWDRPDPGSMLLLDTLPPLAGRVMDLCCGQGLLAHRLLAHRLLRDRRDAIEALHLVDADANALACARRNIEHHNAAFHWLDAASEPLPAGMDAIVCNPPFHRGHARDVALGRRILLQGLNALRKGGRMFVVANRQLAYEGALSERAASLGLLRQEAGYKIIEVVR